MPVTPNRLPTLFPALRALLLTLSVTAHAQEPAKPATPATPAAATPEPQMFIWGGGAKREDAEKALADYESSKGGWEEYYTLAEGFPRILESKTVPGLKPGFFIVALGVCPAPEATALLDTFKAFTPSVYARPVTWEEKAPACPKATGGWKVDAVERWKKKGVELTAVKLNQGKAWKVWMVLRDKKGKELEQRETDAKEAQGQTGASIVSCHSDSVYFDKAGPVISLGCSMPGCTTLAEGAWDITYTIQGESLSVDTQQTDYVPGECD
jgi:hypothetical protein